MEELPPGFRFYPTEEELVSFYLRQKLDGTSEDLNRVMDRIIPVLDIYEFSPWELPQFAGDKCNSDPEQWFFFIPRQESEARGGRPRRLTTTGYWKATGSPGPIYSNNRNVGIKRTMVFYEGRAPGGKKTEWKMNEYKAIQGESSSSSSSSTSTQPQLRHEFSLCRVYKKTKSIRAFDRRPVGVMNLGGGTSTRSQHSSYVGNYEATNTTSHHQNPSSMVVERTTISSPESSSSGDPGDGANPSRIGNASGNVASMSVDDSSFFDWDQFDFTYDGQDFN